MKKGSIEIQVPLKVLKALRESSGYATDEIAKKLKTSEERIKSIEEGNSSFTITQIKKLADIYHRPLAAFFETTPPELKYSLTDFRINRDKKLTSDVHLAERRAYYLAGKVAEFGEKKSIIPTFPESLTGDELANQFRKYLGAEMVRSQNPGNILTYYKQALEEKLLISIIEYPLKGEDVRAFCITSDLSIVILNEKDDARIKLFSLFHEVCHLLKKTSAICSIDIETDPKNIETEWYCNLFAAEFLVPYGELNLEMQSINQPNNYLITRLSNRYGVSKQVIMLRLLHMRYIDAGAYYRFKEEQAKKAGLQKKRGSGSRNWDKVFQNRVGNLAIQEVRTAYHKGDISFSEAINVLNMKTKYVEKFIT